MKGTMTTCIIACLHMPVIGLAFHSHAKYVIAVGLSAYRYQLELWYSTFASLSRTFTCQVKGWDR